MQENLFALEGFTFGWFATAFQFIIYALLSGSCFFKNKQNRRAPMSFYVLISVVMVTTMGLSNVSLNYLSYPIQQLFKSCKLIPVIIGGKLIMKRVYSWGEIQSAILLCLGLGVLTLEKLNIEDSKDMEFSLYGIILISVALVADGLIGNIQEKTMKDYSVETDEMVFYSHSLGFILLLFIMIVTGELLPSVTYTANNSEALICLILFSFTGYIGLEFVLGMVKKFGSFVAMTVTSCRKILTIILSFILFPKQITPYFMLAACFVFWGVFLHIYSKNKESVHQFLQKYGLLESEDKNHLMSTNV